ncbi:M23 family metallopeptidase [Leucobacter sp. cx-169]|uniref:M23 family metallopeptidase n=1 Tax=Leucobacter sp. cx-169 TaxID=2770549 RepID=UPI00165D5CD9|nr:M23 family metallopeptidase [Leucobacter sp. cx-169]MBC9927276.1 M23 family metallopeptidase [Leucobacter sp. cx-169]
MTEHTEHRDEAEESIPPEREDTSSTKPRSVDGKVQASAQRTESAIDARIQAIGKQPPPAKPSVPLNRATPSAVSTSAQGARTAAAGVKGAGAAAASVGGATAAAQHVSAAGSTAKSAATAAKTAKAGSLQGAAVEKGVSSALNKGLRINSSTPDSKLGAAKALASNVVSGAAGGAATGAAGSAPGAIAGAALGAAKGVASTAATNKPFRNLLIGVAAVLAAALFALPVGVAVALAAVASTSMGSSLMIASSDSAATHGLSSDEVEAAVGRAEGGDVAPWTIFAAIPQVLTLSDETGPEPSELDDFLAKFTAALDEKDPTRELRNVDAGAVTDEMLTSRARTVLPPEEGGDPDAWAAQEAVKALYVDALTAASATPDEAERIYNLSLAFELGAAPTCGLDLGGAPAGGDSGGGNTLDTMSPEQIANGRVIIGVAKTMFGKDWEQAAVIAIMTSLRESGGMKIFANDGVIGNRPGEAERTDEYPASAYDLVAKSMTLPHQAVGSDYVSLGLFQQQLTGSWGTLDGKNWKNDPMGTMQRLMDPAFSTYAFFRVMQTKEGWQTGDPVVISHKVQGSAHPDGPAEHLPTAKAFVKQHSDAAEVPLPTGATPADSAAGDAVCDGALTAGLIVGGFTHPLGKEFPWASYVDDGGSHSAGAMDIPAPSGTPVYAIAAGTVLASGWEEGGGGNLISIMHADGNASAYAHLSQMDVKPGQVVKAGQRIGLVGSTGNSSGPHLHFEIRVNGKWGKFVKAHQYMKKHGIEMGPCTAAASVCGMSQ